MPGCGELKPSYVAGGDELVAWAVGMGNDFKGHRVSFWGNKHVLKLCLNVLKVDCGTVYVTLE